MVTKKSLIGLILMLLPWPVNGQRLRLIFKDPQILSRNVNTAGEEIMPILSMTRDTLFFSRAVYARNKGGKYAGMDIWYARYNHNTNTWAKAGNDLPGHWNTRGNNTLIGTGNDGRSFYFNNPRNPAKGIQVSVYKNKKWSRPQLIPVDGIPSSGFHGFYMSPDQSKLIISMEGKDSYGQSDLYVSRKIGGKWSLPENLGPSVNSGGNEISPFLTGDSTRLYFASDGHGGFGDADIFVSDRKYDTWDIWSTPENLGEKINSSEFDAYFSIYDDSVCFLSSNRDNNLSDIYMAQIINEQENKRAIIGSMIRDTKELLNDINGTGTPDQTGGTSQSGGINKIPEALVTEQNDTTRKTVSPKETRGSSNSVTIYNIGSNTSYYVRASQNIIFDDRSANLSGANKDFLELWVNSPKFSDEKVKLTFDSADDSVFYNYGAIFRERLDNIRNYLLRLGVNRSNIIVQDQGEKLNLDSPNAENTVIIQEILP